MDASLFALLGMLDVVIFFFAEHFKHSPIGFVASVFLLFLGIWVAISGLSIVTGTTVIGGCNIMIPFFG